MESRCRVAGGSRQAVAGRGISFKSRIPNNGRQLTLSGAQYQNNSNPPYGDPQSGTLLFLKLGFRWSSKCKPSSHLMFRSLFRECSIIGGTFPYKPAMYSSAHVFFISYSS